MGTRDYSLARYFISLRGPLKSFSNEVLESGNTSANLVYKKYIDKRRFHICICLEYGENNQTREKVYHIETLLESEGVAYLNKDSLKDIKHIIEDFNKHNVELTINGNSLETFYDKIKRHHKL